MKKRNIIMIVVLVLLFLGAGAGVIFGVLTNNERTFRDQATWQTTPVSVSCRPYFQTEDRCNLVERSMNSFNRRLGEDVFIWSEDQDARIEIVTGSPHEVRGSDRLGFNSLEITRDHQRIVSCDILTMNVSNPTALDAVILHELGHCLNLVHDDSGPSIMNPDNIEGGGRLTDSDRNAIRERYNL